MLIIIFIFVFSFAVTLGCKEISYSFLIISFSNEKIFSGTKIFLAICLFIILSLIKNFSDVLTSCCFL
ncbi:hypothetical protein [Candidatus Phytoplasma prunorum]|uniref:hypothetical protein n=1 Tax=Candidatus Phytoplasma prunorum TaxID=47565 RepID=UPI00349F6CDF